MAEASSTASPPGVGRRVTAVTRRAVGAASRRLGRPELLAAVDATARVAEREEIGIRAVLAATLDENASYVDVGANRGQLLRLALRVAPRGRHVAFEPIPTLCAELARAFPTVDCRQLAVGATPGTARFCHFTELDGWSGLRRSPQISDERGRPEFISVTVSTLDRELGDVRPGVIKLDVEGAELQVLQGARVVLQETRPVVIFEHVPQATALYGDSSQAIWELFAELGYTIFSVTGEGPHASAELGAGGHAVNWLARSRS